MTGCPFPPVPEGIRVDHLLDCPDEVEISYDGVYPGEVDYLDTLARRAAGGLARILDVGCLFGRVSLPLARRGHDVVGVDCSPRMLEGFRQRALRDGIDCRIVGSGLEAVPPLTPCVDVATCTLGVLSTIADEETLLAHFRGLARVVRPGGIACGVVPAAEEPAAILPHRASWVVTRGGSRASTDYAFWRPQGGTLPGDRAEYFHRLTLERAGAIRVMEWRGDMVIFSNALLARVCSAVPQWSVMGWNRVFDPDHLHPGPIPADVCSIFLLRREEPG